MCKYPEKRWLQFLLLRIIYDKPTYGYEIIEKIPSLTCGCQKHETGAVYTVLRRMEQNGLVTSKWARKVKGLDRRTYKITKKGTAVLKEGLELIKRRKELVDNLIDFYNRQWLRDERG